MDIDDLGEAKEWMAMHWSGYLANFANYLDQTDPAQRYRSLGAVHPSKVGSQTDRPADEVGAAMATMPERMIMLCDAGFITLGNDDGVGASAMTGQKLGHDAGWGVLLADGHSAQFAQPNDAQPWYAHWVLKPELRE